MNRFTPTGFFDLANCQHAALFDGLTYVWQAIPRIGDYIQTRFDADLMFEPDELKARFPYAYFSGENIYVAPNVTIDPTAYIQGPALIESGSQIRHGAFVRGNVILCSGAVVGHTTEVKNAVLLEGAGAPHFAYVGDSILGRNVNLGAGTKLSNFPLVSGQEPRPIQFTFDGAEYDTGLVKMGAVLGDGVQLGCNCVTNPGCLVDRETLVYPMVSLSKGYYPAKSVIKLRQQVEVVERHS